MRYEKGAEAKKYERICVVLCFQYNLILSYFKKEIILGSDL